MTPRGPALSLSKGFTLIELMIAMFLMSMVTATCIWVFRQSLNIYDKSTGNAEVNQNWQVAMNKIGQDLSSCLPLNSGEQRFVMISRFADDEEFGRSFPRDYLSFATTTRVMGETTAALVSYDIIETASGLPILMRYITRVEDIDLGDPVSGLPLEDSTINGLLREVLAEYCTMLRIEYFWRDPRPVGAAGDAAFKQVEDPGNWFSLHPDINEDDAGLDADGLYLTGGLNGLDILQNSDTTLHASTGGDVLDDFYASYLLDSGNFASNPGIQIPFRNLGGTPLLELAQGVPSWVRRRGSGGTINRVNATMATGLNARNRIILICSPNLWHFSPWDPTHEPLDITANFGGLFSDPTDPVAIAQDYSDTAPSYLFNNSERFPTYLPNYLRITMKIHNRNHTSIITRSREFWLPNSGS